MRRTQQNGRIFHPCEEPPKMVSYAFLVHVKSPIRNCQIYLAEYSAEYFAKYWIGSDCLFFFFEEGSDRIQIWAILGACPCCKLPGVIQKLCDWKYATGACPCCNFHQGACTMACSWGLPQTLRGLGPSTVILSTPSWPIGSRFRDLIRVSKK